MVSSGTDLSLGGRVFGSEGERLSVAVAAACWGCSVLHSARKQSAYLSMSLSNLTSERCWCGKETDSQLQVGKHLQALQHSGS